MHGARGGDQQDARRSGAPDASRQGGRRPAPEWFHECLARAVGGQAGDILAASAAGQPGLLARAGSVRGGRCPVAAGLHDIARWDGRPGTHLVRSRRKGGTQCLEEAMAAQCVEGDARVTPAMVPVGAPGSMPDTLRRPMGMAGRAWGPCCPRAAGSRARASCARSASTIA